MPRRASGSARRAQGPRGAGQWGWGWRGPSAALAKAPHGRSLGWGSAAPPRPPPVLRLAWPGHPPGSTARGSTPPPGGPALLGGELWALLAPRGRSCCLPWHESPSPATQRLEASEAGTGGWKALAETPQDSPPGFPLQLLSASLFLGHGRSPLVGQSSRRPAAKARPTVGDRGALGPAAGGGRGAAVSPRPCRPWGPWPTHRGTGGHGGGLWGACGTTRRSRRRSPPGTRPQQRWWCPLHLNGPNALCGPLPPSPLPDIPHSPLEHLPGAPASGWGGLGGRKSLSGSGLQPTQEPRPLLTLQPGLRCLPPHCALAKGTAVSQSSSARSGPRLSGHAAGRIRHRLPLGVQRRSPPPRATPGSSSARQRWGPVQGSPSSCAASRGPVDSQGTGLAVRAAWRRQNVPVRRSCWGPSGPLERKKAERTAAPAVQPWTPRHLAWAGAHWDAVPGAAKAHQLQAWEGAVPRRLRASPPSRSRQVVSLRAGGRVGGSPPCPHAGASAPQPLPGPAQEWWLLTRERSCFATASISFCFSRSFFRNCTKTLFFRLASFILRGRQRGPGERAQGRGLRGPRCALGRESHGRPARSLLSGRVAGTLPFHTPADRRAPRPRLLVGNRASWPFCSLLLHCPPPAPAPRRTAQSHPGSTHFSSKISAVAGFTRRYLQVGCP